jgi:hypothetical protein
MDGFRQGSGNGNGNGGFVVDLNAQWGLQVGKEDNRTFPKRKPEELLP